MILTIRTFFKDKKKLSVNTKHQPKEYEIKSKMEQEQLLELKILFSIGL